MNRLHSFNIPPDVKNTRGWNFLSPHWALSHYTHPSFLSHSPRISSGRAWICLTNNWGELPLHQKRICQMKSILLWLIYPTVPALPCLCKVGRSHPHSLLVNGVQSLRHSTYLDALYWEVASFATTEFFYDFLNLSGAAVIEWKWLGYPFGHYIGREFGNGFISQIITRI